MLEITSYLGKVEQVITKKYSLLPIAVALGVYVVPVATSVVPFSYQV